MFWKSISATLPPHVGSGFFMNSWYDLRRNSRIHAGSPFISEIWATTSASSPLRDLKTGLMSSWKPNFSLYPSRMSSVCGCVMAMAPSSRASSRGLNVPDPVVTLGLELVRQLGASRLDDAAVDQHVDELRLDVVQDPLVVRDQEHPEIGAGERVHALRNDPERVDVEPRVGLVEDRDLRLQDRHLQDLGALLLAARESVVDVAPRERVVHLEDRHLLLHERAEFLRRERLLLAPLLPARGQGHAQEVGDAHAGDRRRILEREEEALPAPLVRGQLEKVLSVQEDLPLGHLVLRVAHECV